MLIGFIAPYFGVKVSPAEEVRATISLADELGVEALLRELRRVDASEAYLLVNSPVGGLGSSYKLPVRCGRPDLDGETATRAAAPRASALGPAPRTSFTGAPTPSSAGEDPPQNGSRPVSRRKTTDRAHAPSNASSRVIRRVGG